MTWIEEGGIEEGVEDFAKNFDTVDTIMLGRNTYEDLARKWPNVKTWPNVDEPTLKLGALINSLPKIIVSGGNNVEDPKWGDFEPPTVMTGNDIEDQIKVLKTQDGKDIITFGSPTLVQSLTNANLVNEFRIIVHPVVVEDDGRRRLFENIIGQKDLKLLRTQSYEHGSVVMCYETRP
jgi:dihydrofolate reductase